MMMVWVCLVFLVWVLFSIVWISRVVSRWVVDFMVVNSLVFVLLVVKSAIRFSSCTCVVVCLVTVVLRCVRFLVSWLTSCWCSAS